jgi:2-oxoglutarate dehydrogenase complex dehydrogenase (E1) component-like enzyme
VAEGHEMKIRYAGRPERASPAEGYPAAHAAEQSRIIREALGTETAKPALKTTMLAGEGEG